MRIETYLVGVYDTDGCWAVSGVDFPLDSV